MQYSTHMKTAIEINCVLILPSLLTELQAVEVRQSLCTLPSLHADGRDAWQCVDVYTGIDQLLFKLFSSGNWPLVVTKTCVFGSH